MKISRVLFIIPPRVETLGNVRPSPAVAYLSEFLESNGIETRLLDLTIKDNNQLIEREIKGFSPQLIGYPMFTYKYKYTYDLINKLKREYPDILSVAGGPHISTWREKALKECKGLDFGVVLEGEDTLLELCNGKAPDEILGLISRKDGKVVYSRDRPFVQDLDSIPFPKYNRFNQKDYIEEKIIFTSRGCPYLCSFCPVHTAVGRVMRFRTADSIVDEIEYWYSRGIKQFDFQDDNFTIRKDRIYEICDRIEERNLKNLFLRCSNGIRADKTDRPLLERMKEVGFRSVGIGVESASNVVLKEMKKSVNIEMIEEAIKNLCELDYDVHLFFLVGMPKETNEDLEKTEELTLKYPILKANFYNPIPYPSTALFDYLKKENLFLKDYKEYLNEESNYSNDIIFTTPELSAEDRIKWLKHFKKIEKMVMKRSFQRRMKHLGFFLSRLGAIIFVTDVVQKMLFHNLFVRNLADKVRYRYISKSNITK